MPGSPWYAAARPVMDEWTERILAASDPAEMEQMMATVLPFYLAEPDKPEVAARLAEMSRVMKADLAAGKAWEGGLYQSVDLRPLLQRIACPALIVAGELDFICGPAQARPIAQAIKNSRLVMLGGCGHIPSIEQPERYRHTVLDSLGTLTRAISSKQNLHCRSDQQTSADAAELALMCLVSVLSVTPTATRRLPAVRRVLLTGMSETGKSSVVQALAARGYKAIDTNKGCSEPLPGGRSSGVRTPSRNSSPPRIRTCCSWPAAKKPGAVPRAVRLHHPAQRTSRCHHAAACESGHQCLRPGSRRTPARPAGP